MRRSPTVSAGSSARAVPWVRISWALFWMAMSSPSELSLRQCCPRIRPLLSVSSRVRTRDGTGRVNGMDHFPFDFDPRYATYLGVAGIRPSTAGVRVTDERLEVDFGPW